MTLSQPFGSASLQEAVRGRHQSLLFLSNYPATLHVHVHISIPLQQTLEHDSSHPFNSVLRLVSISAMLPLITCGGLSAKRCMRLIILISLLFCHTPVECHVITAAPQLDRSAWDNAGWNGTDLFARAPNAWLGRRDDSLHNCDGHGLCTQRVRFLRIRLADTPPVTCGTTATCYTGLDGYIGCCSA